MLKKKKKRADEGPNKGRHSQDKAGSVEAEVFRRSYEEQTARGMKSTEGAGGSDGLAGSAQVWV